MRENKGMGKSEKLEILYIKGCASGTKKHLKEIGKLFHRSMSGQALAFIEEGARRFEEEKKQEGGAA